MALVLVPMVWPLMEFPVTENVHGIPLWGWLVIGACQAHEYLAAYLIEKSLSLENLFVFLIIFRNPNIPEEYQTSKLSIAIFSKVLKRALAQQSAERCSKGYNLFLTLY